MARLIVAVVIVGFTVYCLIDAIRTERGRVRGLPRALWIVLILAVPVLGGLMWLVAGRPRSGGGGSRGGKPRHIGTPPTAPPSVQGPDDDPDFLRGLDRRLRDQDGQQESGPGKGPGTKPGSEPGGETEHR